MDDPIFGPWSDQEDAAPTPPFRAPRWRPRAPGLRDVPGRPPAVVFRQPEPPSEPRADGLARVLDRSEAHGDAAPSAVRAAPLGPVAVEEALDGAAPVQAVAVDASDDPRPDAPPFAPPDSEGDGPPPIRLHLDRDQRDGALDHVGGALDDDDVVVREAVPTPADPAIVKLRTLLVPACKALSQRLVVHRHLTTLDDRLDWNPPSVRFRVEPWRAPFDPPEAHPSSAIEFELEDGKRLAARVWMDVFSTVPDHRDAILIESLTSTWIEKTLMGYVTRVLAGL